jgi:hypothetical protein
MSFLMMSRIERANISYFCYCWRDRLQMVAINNSNAIPNAPPLLIELNPAAAVLTSSTELRNVSVKSLWPQLLMAFMAFQTKQ